MSNINFYFDGSSFGHLDGINAVIRSGNQNFYISDAHVRFERSTEVRAKETQTVEEVTICILCNLPLHIKLIILSC